MPVGRPFVVGDPRRGPGRKRGAETARSLARGERAGTIAALVRLREQADDLRVAREACELLLRYSDGEPGTGNVPTEIDESAAETGELAAVLELLQQPVAPADVAPQPPERGGDSGDQGEGNGGAA